MPRISDYDIIYCEEPDDVSREMRDALADGWVPMGGVTVSPSGWFAQAIVKHAE